jgi:hypothetical protein
MRICAHIEESVVGHGQDMDATGNHPLDAAGDKHPAQGRQAHSTMQTAAYAGRSRDSQGVSAGPVISTLQSARLPSSTRTNTDEERLSGSDACNCIRNLLNMQPLHALWYGGLQCQCHRLAHRSY